MKLARSAALIAILTQPAFACEGLAVSGGWVRAAPPGVMMMAAYAQFKNNGSAPLIVESVSSDSFGLSEMHETQVIDGQSRMREIAPLTLAPGAAVDFVPGGKHLMLMRQQKDLAPGDSVGFRFHCTDGKTLDTAFPVRVPE